MSSVVVVLHRMRQRRNRREKDNERYDHYRKWVGVHGKRGIDGSKLVAKLTR